MSHDPNEDFSFLDDLDAITESQGKQKPNKEHANFSTEKLEDRILFSATWIDADTGEPVADSTDGDDVFSGSSESDAAGAGGGNDILAGLEGNDFLDGELGDDEIDGGQGNDHLVGGQGNDTLNAGQGNDFVNAGDGDDFIVGGSGNDVIVGGAGHDTVDFSDATESVNVDITIQESQDLGSEGEDLLLSIEGVVGSDHDDTFAFSEPEDGAVYTVDGRGGSNTIDVSGFSSDDAFADGNSVTISNGTTTFTIEHDNVDSFQFSDGEFDPDLIPSGEENLPDLERGRVLHLDFEDTDNLGADGSGIGNHATEFGDVVAAQNNSAEFDGNDALFVASDRSINKAIVQERTISVSFQVDNLEGRQVVYEEGGSTRGLSIYVDDGELIVGGWNHPNRESDWNGTFLNLGSVTAGELNSVAVTLDGGPEVTQDAFNAFLNGEHAATGPGSQLWPHGDPIGVGGLNATTYFHDGAARGNYGLNGTISEVAVYDRVVNTAEIAMLAGNVPDVVEANGEIHSVSFVAANDGGSVSEFAASGTFVGSIAAADADDGESFSYDLTEDANGRFEIDENGVIRVADGASFDHETEPTITISTEVTDSAGHTESLEFTLDVTNVNEGQITQGESFTLNEDGSVSGNLLANDLDIDGDELTIESFSQPEHGTLTVDNDGNFTYQPNGNFSGTDSFTYTMTDGNGETSTETVNIDVVAVADGASLAVSDASGNEDTAIDLDISASLIDTDGSETITDITISNVPDGAQLSAGTDNGDGSWTLTTDDLDGLTVTPGENSHEDFELTIEVTTADGDSTQSVQQTLNVEVVAVNDAVTDLQISNTSVAENSPAGTVVGALSATDVDSGETFTYEIVDADGNVVEDAHFEVVDNQVVVKSGADLNFENSQSHQLNVRVTDSGGATHTEQIDISVTNVNEGQITQGESFTLNEDGSVSGNLLANDLDIDGDELTIESFDQPEHGTVTVDNDGNFTYQPNGNFSGTDSFTYTMTDGNGETSTETVNIDVVAVADGASLAVSDASGNEDTAIDLDISASLIDTDGSETITDITISNVPDGAQLSAGTDNGDGSWTLTTDDLDGLTVTPGENSHEDFELTIEVTTADGDSTQSVQQTLNVEVVAVNDAVTDLQISNTSVAENSPAGTVVGALSATDVDSGETFTYEIVDADGNVVEDAHFEVVDNQVVVKSGADLNFENSQSHQLNVRVTDSGGATHTEQIDISVTNVNEGQITQGESFTLNEDGSVSGNLLANDLDIDGDELTIESFDQPEHGTVTVDNDGNFTYQPNGNFSGTDSFTYTMTDGNGETSTETVNIDVVAVADGASLAVSDASGNEDTAIDLDISASLIDTDGSETITDITISNVPDGAQLSAGTDNGDGSWTLTTDDLDGLTVTPGENSHEDFELTIEVTTADGDSTQSVQQTLNVEVVAVNDAVTDLQISNTSVAENSPAGTVVGALSATDVDSGETFTYEIVDADGNVVEDAHFEVVDNQVVVKSGADLNFENSQSHQLNVRVTDSGGATHTEQIDISVTNVNEGQITQGESFTLNEDGSVSGNLLANDLDIDGDELTIESFDQPEHGTVTVDNDGNFTYQPNGNFSGTDSFTYTMTDGNGETSTETVNIDVVAVADGASLAVSDASGNEDTAIDLDISASLIDTDGSETITDITISNVPDGAQLSAGTDNGDGSWTLTTDDLDGLTVTPGENSHEDFELTIEVTTADGDSTQSVQQTLNVEVVAVNDAVTDLQISNTSVAENSPAGTVVGALSATDVDSGETFTYEIVDADGNVVEDAHFEVVDNQVVVKSGADLNFENSQSHQLNVRVTDSGGATHTEQIDISVTNVNEGQITQGESFTLNEDGSVSGNLLANDLDIDGDELTIESFDQPEHGTVTVDNDGNFTYQPNGNFSGTDSFTYTMTDGNGETSTETVNIDVVAVADGASLAVSDASGNEDTAIDLDISASLIDTDGSETITDITISNVPDGAQLSAGTDNGDGSWTLTTDDLDGLTVTPGENSHEDFELTIEVTTADGDSTQSVQQTLNVEVVAVNDAVTDLQISNTSVAENSPAGTVVGALSATDVDSGETFTYEIVDADGNVVEDAHFEVVDNQVVVKSGADLNFENSQSHQLNVRVTDSGGATHTEQIDISVTNVNEGQITQGESFTLNEDGSVSGNLLANDLDIDGDELTIESFDQPEHGTVTVDNDGNFTYQPNGNFSGTDSFTYTMTDGNGETSTETVNIDVVAVADAAHLNVSNASGNEDTAIDLDISASLVDTDGSETITDITISNVPGGAQLSAGTDNGDGSWTLTTDDLDGLTVTPGENSHEDFELTIEVTTADGDSTQSVQQTLNVEVVAVNDAVTDLQISNTSVAENSPAGTVVGALSATDVDANETFTYEIVDTDGNVVEDAHFEVVDNQVVVKSGADLNFENSQSHQLNVRVTDSGGATHTEQIDISITNVNEGQITQGESFTLNEDGSVSGNLLANDLDIDGDELTIESFDQPEHGTVTVDNDGNFTYQPNGNFSGTDSFTYTMTDGNGETSTETVNIDVVAVADGASLAVSDASGNEDTAIDLDISASLIDTDGSETITDITISNVPDGAQLSAGTDNGDGSWTLTTDDLDGLTVTPGENSHEDFELTIEVTTADGDSTQSVQQTLNVEVVAVNDAVTDLQISNTSVAENSPAGTVVGALSATDVDSGETFTYEIVDADGNVVEDAHFEVVDNQVVVKSGADLNFENSQSHQLNVRVTDSGGATHTEQIDISVTNVNEGQITQGESFTLNEDGSVSGNLLANDLDIDGDELTIESFDQPEHGTVTVDNDGNFTYQPNGNFSGTDSFTYTMTDGNGETSTETVNIDVVAVADAAHLNVSNASGNEDTAIDLDISASLVDTDGSETITDITISNVPGGAQLSAGTDNGDGSWTLTTDDLDGLTVTPGENSHEDFELTIEVTTADGDSTQSVQQTLNVEVVAVNDAVTDLQISNTSVAENSPAGTVVGALSATDVDANETFTYEIVDTDGNVVEDAHFEVVDNQVVVKSGADLNFENSQSHQLNVRVTDSGGATHTEQIDISITNVNEGQITQGESFTLNEDGSVSGNLLANDLDIDGDELTIESFDQPEHGTVTVDNDGNFTYQPNGNFSGTDSFTYTMTDGNGETSTETVNIDVVAVADGASLAVSDASGNEDTAIDLDISASLIDTDGSETITDITISNVPDGAQLSAGTDNGDGSWTLTTEHLRDLQLNLDGYGNTNFDLQINVTTTDGETVNRISDTISVDLQHDTLEGLLSEQARNVQTGNTTFTTIEQSIDPRQQHADTESQTIDEFEAAFNQIQSQVSELQANNLDSISWNSPEFDFIGLDSGDDNGTQSDDDQSVAEVPRSVAEIEAPLFPAPQDMQMLETEPFEISELADLPVQVTGLNELDDSGDIGNLSTASLLLLCTRREDSRKQLLKLQRANSDNKNE